MLIVLVFFFRLFLIFVRILFFVLIFLLVILLRFFFLRLRLRRFAHPVRQHILRRFFHILGQNISAPRQGGNGSRRFQQIEIGPMTGTVSLRAILHRQVHHSFTGFHLGQQFPRFFYCFSKQLGFFRVFFSEALPIGRIIQLTPDDIHTLRFFDQFLGFRKQTETIQ